MKIVSCVSRRALLLLIALQISTACARSDETAVLPNPEEVSLTLDLAIGDESGTDEYTLSSVSEVLTDDAGLIYVGSNPVRVYSPEGTYLRRLGGVGDGPGEMRMPGSPLVWPDGTVDLIGVEGRWVRWDASGSLLFDHRPYDIRASLNTHRLPTRRGEISYSYRSPWSRGTADTVTALWVLRCDADLQVIDIAARFPPGLPTSVWNQQFEGHMLGSMLPFNGDHMIRALPRGGYVFARADSAAIDWFTEGFELRGVSRWHAEPDPLREEDFLAYFSSREQSFVGERDPAWQERNDRMIRFVLSQERSDTKPLIADVLVGLDGRLWIEQWGPHQNLWTAPPGTPYRYWVIGTDGRYEFECSLPFAPTAATDTYLFEAFSDGEHTPQARRYRWRVVR